MSALREAMPVELSGGILFPCPPARSTRGQTPRPGFRRTAKAAYESDWRTGRSKEFGRMNRTIRLRVTRHNGLASTTWP